MDERPRRTQEALLVGVQDCHQRHLRKVDPLAKKVDAHNHVKDPEAQVAQNLNALERVNLAVEVAHANPRLLKVRRELFGHAFRERRNDHALLLLHATLDALEEIVDLPLRREHGDVGVHNSCWADQLLHHLVCALSFVAPWRC